MVKHDLSGAEPRTLKHTYYYRCFNADYLSYITLRSSSWDWIKCWHFFMPNEVDMVTNTAVTALDDFKMLTCCDVIDTWARHEPAAGNCHITMTDYFRGVSVDVFLSQWRWGQWFKEFIKYTSVSSFSSFIIERGCGSVNYLASDVMINWRWARSRHQWRLWSYCSDGAAWGLRAVLALN